MLVDCSGKSRESLYDKVHEAVDHARACYYDGSTDAYNDQVFTEMMLGDSCLLICFLICKKRIGPQEIVDTFERLLGWLLYSLVNRDIFLLENQIPFRILMSLIDFAYNGKVNQVIDIFLHQTIWGQYTQQPQMTTQCQPLTLFHAFHGLLVFDRNPVVESGHIDIEQVAADYRERQHTFLSATALKAKGIWFKWCNKKSLKAFSFTSYAYYGELQLPSWFVSDLSETFFQNMIAYELCPDARAELTVTTYVKFMKSLITSPADVKELREERILLTSLGSDEEVVNLFKNLKTYGREDPRTLMAVKKRIQQHFDSKGKTLIAELIQKYFSSLWAVIAWFGFLQLLLLTMIQTYYTVKSCK